MSEDVFRVMDDEGIDKACLMGHSMGGKTCMTAALTEVGIDKACLMGHSMGGKTCMTAALTEVGCMFN